MSEQPSFLVFLQQVWSLGVKHKDLLFQNFITRERTVDIWKTFQPWILAPCGCHLTKTKRPTTLRDQTPSPMTPAHPLDIDLPAGLCMPTTKTRTASWWGIIPAWTWISLTLWEQELLSRLPASQLAADEQTLQMARPGSPPPPPAHWRPRRLSATSSWTCFSALTKKKKKKEEGET